MPPLHPKSGHLRHLCLLAAALSAAPGFSQEAQPPPADAPALAAPAASDPSPDAAPAPADDAMTLVARLPLSELQEKPGPVMLRTVEAAGGFPVPISRRMKVTAARTEVIYANSISMLDQVSQIALRWDHTLLAEAPLLKQAPNGRILEELPIAQCEPGYHHLHVSVAQHYVIGECEDPTSSVLWTEIDTGKSWVEIEYGLHEIDPRLSDLEWLIDERLWGDYQLSIVTPDAEPTDRTLRWGALAAGRAGLLLGYKPLFIESGGALPEDRDAIVIGQRSQLSGLLDEAFLAECRGATLGIRVNPHDSRFFVLVLTGDTEADVNLAVETFALWDGLLPSQRVLHVADLPPQGGEPYLADFTVKSGETVTFAEAGLVTDTVKGMNTPAFRLLFSLPPDAYGREGLNARFRLHFAHGAGLRGDSTMNILLNGEFARAVPLVAGEGAVFRDYLVEIPVRAFRPGKNEIELQTRMVPSHTDHCEMIQQENLLFTLYDDSTFEFPELAHYVRFPDLDLWRRTAFPVTKGPLGEGFVLHVAGREPDTVASAWMLAGKLTQTAGIPLLRMVCTTELPEKGEHWLAVGPTDSLAPRLMQGAPVAFGEGGRLPFFLAEAPAARKSHAVSPGLATGVPRTRLGGTQGANPQVGEQGAVLQYASPFGGAAVATVVTAESATRLSERVGELIRPAAWNALGGDTVVWSGGGAEALRVRRLADPVYLGDPGLRVKSSHWFSRQPWQVVGWVLGGIAVAVFLLKRVLAGYFRRNHPGVEDSTMLSQS